jgi:hypothetical protein
MRPNKVLGVPASPQETFETCAWMEKWGNLANRLPDFKAPRLLDLEQETARLLMVSACSSSVMSLRRLTRSLVGCAVKTSAALKIRAGERASCGEKFPHAEHPETPFQQSGERPVGEKDPLRQEEKGQAAEAHAQGSCETKGDRL